MATESEKPKAEEAKNDRKQRKKGLKTSTIVGFSVLACICVPYIYYAMSINIYGQNNKPKGYYMPGLWELWMTLVGAAVCTVARYLVFNCLYATFYRISKEQNDEQLRNKYAYKACDKLYRSIYFICSSFWGWYVLKDTAWLPWYLGGCAGGDYRNINMSTVFEVYPYSLVSYSFYTFGYHLQDFIAHAFFHERMNDFEEMLLHHIAAVCLYFCYTMGNMFPVGCVIAYLHDLADIPGSLCKFLNSTHYQNTSVVVFFSCMIVWFFTRILSLPQMIQYIFSLKYADELSHF